MSNLIVDDSHSISAPAGLILHPLHDRILAKMHVPEALYKGILWIPDEAKEEPQKGDVIATGPGLPAYQDQADERTGKKSRRYLGSTPVALSVKAGDTILIQKYCGHDVNLGQAPHVMCRETDVIGTIIDGQFVPLHNQVAIRMDEPEQRVGALVVPDSAKRRVDRGTVVAVGMGWKRRSGAVVPMDINVGDRILFSAYSGEDHEVPGYGLLKLTPAEHCLAVLEE